MYSKTEDIIEIVIIYIYLYINISLYIKLLKTKDNLYHFSFVLEIISDKPCLVRKRNICQKLALFIILM